MGTGPNTYPVSRYIYKTEDQCILILHSFSMYPILSVENSDDQYTFASHPEYKYTDSISHAGLCQRGQYWRWT